MQPDALLELRATLGLVIVHPHSVSTWSAAPIDRISFILSPLYSYRLYIFRSSLNITLLRWFAKWRTPRSSYPGVGLRSLSTSAGVVASHLFCSRLHSLWLRSGPALPLALFASRLPSVSSSCFGAFAHGAWVSRPPLLFSSAIRCHSRLSLSISPRSHCQPLGL